MSSARTLDSLYFRLLERRVEGDYEYQSYQSLYAASTMVLFSKTCPTSPIAAVSFLPRYTDGIAKTVLTRRSESEVGVGASPQEYSRFQGLSSVDNTEFTFVIHNLTDFVRSPEVDTYNGRKSDIGCLKIDILGEETEVRQVDLPTIAVNQVNELRPSESVLIECDQRKGNRTMVLRGVVDSKTSTGVTVAQEDAIQETELKKGTYFYINVVASESFPEMVALFEETAWRATDVFVRRVPRNNGISQSNSYESLRDTTLRNDNPYYGSLAENCRNDPLAKSCPSPFAQLQSMSLKDDKLSEKSAATPTNNEVLHSQVGNVVAGSHKVRVITTTTGQEYAYDLPGEKVCLGLSVWRGMRLLTPLSFGEARQESSLQLEDAQNNHSKHLLKTLSKIYKEAKCSICFENEPDIVFLQCGHECVCNKCLENTKDVKDAKKCFICRSPIVAKVATQAL